MRLGTCVALELLVGASLASGLGVSVNWGVQEVREQWAREARAAQVTHAIVANQLPAVAGLEPDGGGLEGPGARGPDDPQGVDSGDQGASETESNVILAPKVALVEPVAQERSYHGVFLGVRDDLLLEPLRGSPIQSVRFNRGGSSISLRITFENGARAAFKPEQAAPQTVPRKEIAAYRIDRLLGLNAVPPAIGGKFVTSELLAAMVPASQVFLPRLQEEMRVTGDEIRGELSWWIPMIKRATVDGYEIDTTDGIVTWKRYLTVGKEMPESEVIMLSQISSMVLFDFLINNPDRWSGANTRTSEDGRTLFYMDNTMSFGAEPEGHRKCRIYLRRVQKFSRSLVASLRVLTEEEVRDVVSHDMEPFEFLLTDREIAAMISRRDHALAYIDELIAEHGESAVLVFP